MKAFKKILPLFLVLLICNAGINKSKDSKNCKFKLVILKGGTLKVNGFTNVNKFSCIVSDDEQNDTLYCDLDSNKTLQVNGGFMLNVFDFNCDNPFMTSDLRKTLKANDYPLMKINFLSFSQFSDLQNKNKLIDGNVEIELSGIKKQYKVNYQLCLDEQKRIQLVGRRTVNFSDFNLIPPKKMGGIIKTKDALNVEFALTMQLINNK